MTLIMFFLLKHFSKVTLFESHDATSQTPMTSTRLPMVYARQDIDITSFKALSNN